MGALKSATENAPSQALAQFARKVAGTKSIADKEKLIADRIKNASQEEADFLNQFVSPLTNFGKKEAGDAAKKLVGREGYEVPVTIDAKRFVQSFEKDAGEAIAWNQDKLNAVRSGAKSVGNIEVAFNPRGKLGVNDGRHRLAIAAERGDKVTVFASPEDAAKLSKQFGKK